MKRRERKAENRLMRLENIINDNKKTARTDVRAAL